ncbi:3-methyladenine DNA glycosylase AlkD [Pullulanibacillus pueri]|uniref:DNA alkylation repair protein n=1 Tax=Pullulanibacillus pueri TaxID=1437324 RepID=A0A8J2ZT96_9BACL|nr:DNA alkylation repair protein [Pullulanibacillus pueri]MBM7681117.1 3-methyladenine DNA glycosylase AlkD [Pullulanibacillus pueri]GGH77113.1 DNA alkylation repair protein [Pullulanibacillus pueri]
MDFEPLFIALENNRDEERSVKMSAYMRNQFQFLGIPTPKRRILCKELFKKAVNEKQVDWSFIDECWKRKYREYQYIAIDYLSRMQQYLSASDISKIKKLATTKSWWDTIDGLDNIVGEIALAYPEVNDTLLQWSIDDNFWLRRIAIDHQLSRKSKTNTELLETVVKNNLGHTEFFINKAIGWSLREYSKTNPEWVRHFIETYQEKMAPLSIKEASKHLDN